MYMHTVMNQDYISSPSPKQAVFEGDKVLWEFAVLSTETSDYHWLVGHPSPLIYLDFSSQTDLCSCIQVSP